MKYLGYPYTATGNSPSTGFSCIGFVSFVYRSNGIPLPGDLGDALAYAPQVSFSSLEPGDILYFQNTVWAGLSHAAIYIGGGKFIHAEWYNRGVVISSFASDPVDGNYWTAHYMTANRPWTGAAVTPVVGSTGSTPPSGTTTAPGTTSTTAVATGPTAVVTVPSLNVRSGPSKNSSVEQVVPRGTTLVILGKKNGWYKVQLPSGTVGWVVAAGIGLNGSTTPSGSNGSTGNATAPTRTGYPTATHHHATVSVKVAALRVHSSPSISAPVVGSASRGERVVVVGRSGGWLKVRLPDGTVGWLMAAYTSTAARTGTATQSTTHTTTRSTAQTTTRSTARTTSRLYGSRAHVATNVRSAPSLSASIVTVIPPGGSYRVSGWSNGWAHVQLPSGLSGWVSGTVMGGKATTASGPTYHSYSYGRTRRTARKTTSFQGGSVLTAGVRVHSRPGVKSPVVGLAAAGTHVKVLGYSAGWDRIRLATGMSGYVLGIYVR